MQDVEDAWGSARRSRSSKRTAKGEEGRWAKEIDLELHLGGQECWMGRDQLEKRIVYCLQLVLDTTPCFCPPFVRVVHLEKEKHTIYIYIYVPRT